MDRVGTKAGPSMQKVGRANFHEKAWEVQSEKSALLKSRAGAKSPRLSVGVKARNVRRPLKRGRESSLHQVAIGKPNASTEYTQISVRSR